MTRTSLLPFLYQTRTLQRLPQPVFATWRRHLHGRQQRAARAYFKKDVTSTTRDPIPFELPPDLQDLIPKEADGVSESEISARSTITPIEQNTFDLIFQEIATRYGSSLPPRSSSMGDEASASTPPPTFPSLEADVPTNAKDANESRPAQTAQRTLGPQAGPDPARGKGVINLIIQDAADSSARRKKSAYPFDPISALGALGASADPGKAFLRFPPSLRAAARLAFEGPSSRQNLPGRNRVDREGEADSPTEERGSDDALSSRGLPGRSLTDVAESELLRSGERARVEALMHKATTDFELWDVLEREVFTMVDRLGIRDTKAKSLQNNTAATSNRNQRRSRRKGLSSTDEQESSSESGARDSGDAVTLPTTSEPLSTHVFGPLYPSYLLLALRMLDTSFAAPSPLVLALLPRIKELGLASYLLGATTPLYTEIATVLWRRSGAVMDVLALFEEMHHAGLYFSQETLRLVDSISDTMSKARQGEQGRFLQGLAVVFDIDDNMFVRLRHWRKLIYWSMSTRMDELGY